MSIRTKKDKRKYRKITPATVAKFKADVLLHGNGTRAVQMDDDEYLAPEQRAHRILTIDKQSATPDIIENALQQIAVDAVQVLSNSVNSTDEAIALNATKYTIDHLRGKAVQRSESKNLNISIESVL